MDYAIREAVPGDAEPVIAYMHALSNEPNATVPISPGEFDMSIEDERAFIQRHLDSDNSILLLALHGDQIIGLMNITGGKRKAMRHSGVLGISIHKDWRDKGVGRAMMTHALDWARNTDVLTRIELQVYAHNDRAVHLYEKLGFRHEGVSRRAIYQHGRYIDTLNMALLFSTEPRP